LAGKVPEEVRKKAFLRIFAKIALFFTIFFEFLLTKLFSSSILYPMNVRYALSSPKHSSSRQTSGFARHQRPSPAKCSTPPATLPSPTIFASPAAFVSVVPAIFASPAALSAQSAKGSLRPAPVQRLFSSAKVPLMPSSALQPISREVFRVNPSQDWNKRLQNRIIAPPPPPAYNSITVPGTAVCLALHRPSHPISFEFGTAAASLCLLTVPRRAFAMQRPEGSPLGGLGTGRPTFGAAVSAYGSQEMGSDGFARCQAPQGA
jgi:hypothetical protein